MSFGLHNSNGENDSLMGIRLTTADKVDQELLQGFISEMFGAHKSEFLSENGAWWYRGQGNRIVMFDGEKIVGYCAAIPSNCRLDGQTAISAVWWVDIMISPRYRGKGLHSLLDRKIKEMGVLKFGFPNQPVTAIHKRKGWQVREDLWVCTLPLRPLEMKKVVGTLGVKGALYKIGAALLSPVAASARLWYAHYEPKNGYVVVNPSPALLAGVFFRAAKNCPVTTLRDEAFFRWRYLQAPYQNQLRFYFVGSQEAPTHYLIARHMDVRGKVVTRILDCFGDLNDWKSMRELLLLSTKDAVRIGSTQISILVTLDSVARLVRSLGFILRARSRFCWYCESTQLINTLSTKCYWTLGDSDSDEPA